MEFGEILLLICLIIPIFALIFGCLEAVERSRDYGKSDQINSVSKGAGILGLPAIIVQLIPFCLYYLSDSRIWRLIMILGSIVLMLVFVPKNFQLGYKMTRKSKL
jgi:uncharacterized membrane protein